MLNLSLKELKSHAQHLGAYDLGGDIYTYENDIHYISALKKVNNTSICDTLKVNEIIANIFNEYPTAAYCSRNQLAYSCGIYGNAGQLHELEIYDASHHPIGAIYTYC